MALLTCNGLTVVRAMLSLPSAGQWVADLALAEDAVPAAPMVVEGPGIVLRGTLVRGAGWRGRTGARLVGGTGGLVRPVGAKYYQKAPARLLVGDILSEVGETLSSTSDAAVLGTMVASWPRAASSAALALELVVQQLGAVWRVLEDGTVWVGRHAWATTTAAYKELGVDDSIGLRSLGVEDFELRPGTTLVGGQRIGGLVFEASASRVRAEIHVQR